MSESERPAEAAARLSASFEELVVEVQGRTARADGDGYDCDTLVVGSGYGGAVAAARLSGLNERDGQPTRLWLLERGLEHRPGDFPSRWSELPGQVRFGFEDGAPPRGRPEGLFDLRLGPKVSVVLGNGLGGGSLINAGVMLEPDEDVWAQGWPRGTNAAGMKTWFEKAKKELRPTQSLGEERFPKLVALERLNPPQVPLRVPITANQEKNTVQTPAGVALRHCTGCGDCATGCNQGAKGSLDTSYLATAYTRGARLFTGGVVGSLWRHPEGGWVVQAQATAPERRGTGGSPLEIRARRVVLAAGALGTTEILLRAQADGLALSKKLGARFSTNGDCIAAGVGHLQPVRAVADAESDPADSAQRQVGPTITGSIQVPAQADGTPAFRVQEFAVPAALRNVLAEVAALARSAPALFMAKRPGSGLDERLQDWFLSGSVPWVDSGAGLTQDPYAASDELVERTSVWGLMGDDGAQGLVSLPAAAAGAGAADRGVALGWAGPLPMPLHEAMGRWLGERLSPAQAVVPPLMLQALGAELALPTLTVHPLGGCAMANEVRDGVVDSFGRVFDASAGGKSVHEGLVVLDGAIAPRALGVNPALTITALAERGVAQVRADWHLSDPGPGVVPRSLPPRPVARRMEWPSGETRWALRERLRGPCVLAGHSYDAQLDLEFEPVPGFRRALNLSRRVVVLKSGRLTLTPRDQPGPARHAVLSGSIEWFAPVPSLIGREATTLRVFAERKLVYRLAVVALDGELPGLEVGAGLQLSKTVFPSGLNEKPVLRAWMDAEVRLGENASEVWSLDLDSLADRGEILVGAERIGSLPDAVDDAAGLLLHVLRGSVRNLVLWYAVKLFGATQLGDASRTEPLRAIRPSLGQLDQRWPQASHVPKCQRFERHLSSEAGGWRLSAYRRSEPSQRRPVMLVHGLGMSGASFTHPSIPTPLARHLFDTGREVWVLDLRSSTANEDGRHSPDARHWTVDRVADDVREAVAFVHEHTESQVDVVAHCMGAVMFCLEVLRHDTMARHIGAVVLSQVGPRARLSPLNRVRSVIAAYLLRFLSVDEFDTTPEYRSVPAADGTRRWEPAPGLGLAMLGDLLASTFPYSTQEQTEDQEHELIADAYLLQRHRADMIFGQLYEAAQLAPNTAAHLAALFGWVKVPMLAQAIQFVRQGMLVGESGNNEVVDLGSLRARFAFPLLMVHGARNAVFQLAGSMDSLTEICRSRGLGQPAPTKGLESGPTMHGERGAQLLVLDEYGHLDCLIGKNAANDVFEPIKCFLDHFASLPRDVPRPQTEQQNFEVPALGPVLGRLSTDSRGRLRARVWLKASGRRKGTEAVLMVPLRGAPGARVPDPGAARLVRWYRTAWLRFFSFDWAVPRSVAGDEPACWAVVTVHDAGLWAGGGRVVDAARLHSLAEQCEQWLAKLPHDTAESCVLELSAAVRLAADGLAAAGDKTELTLALASCQYPPGLFDAAPADATWRRLQHDLVADEAKPQALFLLGDQVYADELAGLVNPALQDPARARAFAAPTSSKLMEQQQRQERARLNDLYAATWGMPALRHVMARLPVYPMLDDHEVRDGWQGPASRALDWQADEALKAYDQHQQKLWGRSPRLLASPKDPRSAQLQLAGVPVFVLDTRSHRERREPGTVARARMLLPATLQALRQALSELPAHGLVVLALPVPLLPPERFDGADAPARLRSDTFSGFPAEAHDLLELLRQRCEGVLLLSGDSHLSSVTRFEYEGGGPTVVSVVSSGSYAPWPFANQRPRDIVSTGPVRFEPRAGGAAIGGRLHAEAMSTQAGYARVRLRQVDGRFELEVMLRGADGAAVCTRPISMVRLPAAQTTASIPTAQETP